MFTSLANNRTKNPVYDGIGDSLHSDGNIGEMSMTGTGTGGSIGINGTNGSGNINGVNLENSATPRWDQPPLAPSTSCEGLTLTHVETTEYTESVYETVYEYDEDGVAVLTHRKKKRTMADSVYSYDSTRDVSQFVHQSHGRRVIKQSASVSLSTSMIHHRSF